MLRPQKILLHVFTLTASHERISQNYLPIRHGERCQSVQKMVYGTRELFPMHQGLTSSFPPQVPASLLGMSHIISYTVTRVSWAGKVSQRLLGCDARSHNCLGRSRHSCSNLPSTHESEWKCWSHGMAWSKDAKLGVAFRDSYFLEGKSELVSVRELERESSSLRACFQPTRAALGSPAGVAGNGTSSLHCLQGMGPSLGQCHGRKNSHAVCGCPWVGSAPVQWAVQGIFSRDSIHWATIFLLGAKRDRVHSGTEPQVLWENLVENQAPMCGAVSVSCLGQKAWGDGSTGFPEEKWLWASQKITGSENTSAQGVASPPLIHGMDDRAEPRGNKPSASPAGG